VVVDDDVIGVSTVDCEITVLVEAALGAVVAVVAVGSPPHAPTKIEATIRAKAFMVRLTGSG